MYQTKIFITRPHELESHINLYLYDYPELDLVDIKIAPFQELNQYQSLPNGQRLAATIIYRVADPRDHAGENQGITN